MDQDAIRQASLSYVDRLEVEIVDLKRQLAALKDHTHEGCGGLWLLVGIKPAPGATEDRLYTCLKCRAEKWS